MEHLSDQTEVVVFSSRPAGEGGREFTLDEDPTESLNLDPADIEHEDELVAEMSRRGFQLTMVGGGSRSDELRRFYFRQRSGTPEDR